LRHINAVRRREAQPAQHSLSATSREEKAMMCRHSLYAAALAALLGLGAAAPAAAHGGGPVQPYHYGWHHGWHMDPNSMGPGMMGPNGMMPGMMMQGCPMAGPGMIPQGTMPQGMMPQGMMGPGMMSPGMMAPGYDGYRDAMPMMRQGMPGPGMGNHGMENQGVGPGQRGGMMMQPSEAVVSTDDVTRMLERRLAWQGNPHVKLGKVAEKDADTIVAEIVTQDGSLVERLEVDRRNGWMRMVP
jgi:hypothetical protein